MKPTLKLSFVPWENSDWYQLRVEWPKTLTQIQAICLYKEMLAYCDETFGVEYDLHTNWQANWATQEYLDYSPIVNFIFRHEAHCVLFKLRFG